MSDSQLILTTPPEPPVGVTSGTPTARERLLRALRGQPADRVPVWLMRQAGRYLPEYQAVRSGYDFLQLCKTPTAAAEVSLQPLTAIGSDAVIIFNDILLPLEQAGAQVEFDDQGPLVRNAIRTPGDLAHLQTRAVSADEPVAGTIREVRRRAGDAVPILGFAGAPWTLATYWVEGRAGRHFAEVGAMRFRDPALLLALLAQITPVVAEYLKIQVLAGADAVQIFDTWGGLLTPTEFARFSAPFIRQMIAHLRADACTAATPVIVYVNGCTPYLDELATLGADCLSVDWRCDLAAARRALPAGITLQGNLDPLALLAGPEAAECAVEALFAAYPAGPGHVFNLGHGILPQTTPAAVRRLVTAVKHYGAY